MKRIATLAASLAALIAVVALAAPKMADDSHTKWIAESLTQMETIKVGMTRKDLLTVFTTEGGISTRINRTYVFRECPYIKVDAAFQIQEKNDALSGDENTDVITSISKPYLQWAITD
jgi:hypothetical protein